MEKKGKSIVVNSLSRQGEIINSIDNLLEELYNIKKEETSFIPGKTRVRYAGQYNNHEEAIAVNHALNERGWLGIAQAAGEFEREIARYVGMKRAVMTNSGSSANLLAIASVMEKDSGFSIREGDEFIIPALCFPTTINPLLLYRLKPAFVDIDMGVYNGNVEMIKEAISPKTRGIITTHMLGNPYDMDKIDDIVKNNGLFLLEDNCDSLGSKFKGKMTGSFGDLSTFSFYPAHHMTTGGEGGLVGINNPSFIKIVRNLRDWGRGCYCEYDETNPLGACNNRFSWPWQEMYGENSLPDGYDHKYTFTRIGFNLKPTEMQAAFGLAQLKKLSYFEDVRKRNFDSLDEKIKEYEEFFIPPRSVENAEPCWFSYPITLRDNIPFTRKEILTYMEKERNIETRFFFSGNVTRHPAYQGKEFRVVGNLKNCDKVMNDTFFLGIYPGLTNEMIDYVKESIDTFIKRY